MIRGVSELTSQLSREEEGRCVEFRRCRLLGSGLAGVGYRGGGLVGVEV